MATKLRLELKIDTSLMEEILREDFPSITAQEIFDFIKNNGQRFRTIAFSAIINQFKQSYWTYQKMMKNPADLAIKALKQCSPQEREQILYELKGVMN